MRGIGFRATEVPATTIRCTWKYHIIHPSIQERYSTSFLEKSWRGCTPGSLQVDGMGLVAAHGMLTSWPSGHLFYAVLNPIYCANIKPAQVRYLAPLRHLPECWVSIQPRAAADPDTQPPI